MGREVFTQILRADSGEILWDSVENADEWVCGRNDATDALFNFISDKENGIIELNDTHQRKDIMSRLEDIRDKDEKLHNEALDLIDELCIARRNSRTVADFSDFTAEIHEKQRSCEDIYWTAAEDLIHLIQITVDQARTLCTNHYFWSEDIVFANENLRLVMIWSD